eukprot:604079-Amphidinium_carterae.1
MQRWKFNAIPGGCSLRPCSRADGFTVKCGRVHKTSVIHACGISTVLWTVEILGHIPHTGTLTTFCGILLVGHNHSSKTGTSTTLSKLCTWGISAVFWTIETTRHTPAAEGFK